MRFSCSSALRGSVLAVRGAGLRETTTSRSRLWSRLPSHLATALPAGVVCSSRSLPPSADQMGANASTSKGGAPGRDLDHYEGALPPLSSALVWYEHEQPVELTLLHHTVLGVEAVATQDEIKKACVVASLAPPSAAGPALPQTCDLLLHVGARRGLLTHSRPLAASARPPSRSTRTRTRTTSRARRSALLGSRPRGSASATRRSEHGTTTTARTSTTRAQAVRPSLSLSAVLLSSSLRARS